MTEFDIIARLRKLESENDKLKGRVAELERRIPPAAPSPYHDATTYKRMRAADRLPIWPMPENQE